MVKAANSKNRRMAACICLMALLLVYAPMASATLLAVTGACCTGDQCPIHGNRHPAQSGSAQKHEDAPMDCGHENRDGDGTGKIDACSMSCCHTAEQSAVNVHFFLLTPVSHSMSLAKLSTAQIAPAAPVISPIFAPQAPPPKTLAG
jgi:hypothetical protein